ncbi:hypothetical protein BDW66DRAFT_148489 [Aspergillus desertorum]
MDRVLIAALQWLNKHDDDAGAAASHDIYFDNSSFQEGAPSVGPGDVRISSYEALDKLVSSFWNKSVYPALETVVIASHSLGAQMTQRCMPNAPVSFPVHQVPELMPKRCLATSAQPQDSKISFGIMNPGSYAWPVSDRPEHDNDCKDTYNDWPYRIDDGQPDAFPEYVRAEVLASRSMIRERYFSKNIF